MIIMMMIINNNDNNDDKNNNNNNNNNNNKRAYSNPCSGQRACLNLLVRTGRYTMWRDKSPKVTVTLFKFRLLDWRASYLSWSPVRYRPL